MKIAVALAGLALTISGAFAADLPDLGGRKRLEGMGMEVHALCAFDGL